MLQGVLTANCMPCTSTCDSDCMEILIPYTTHSQKRGMINHVCLYTCPFTTRNQEIKRVEKLDQVIKQISEGTNEVIKHLFW